MIIEGMVLSATEVKYMTTTEIEAIRLALEVSKQLLIDTPDIYAAIEAKVKEMLSARGVSL